MPVDTYRSIKWSPKSELTSDALNQMGMNDRVINNFGNRIGYNFYEGTWREQIEIAFDAGGGGFSSIDEATGRFQINVRSVNDFWKFGVNLGSVSITTDAALPSGTTGYNDFAISVYEEHDSGDGSGEIVQNRIGAAFCNSAVPSIATGVPAQYNTTAIGIEFQFLYKFSEHGTHTITLYLDPQATDPTEGFINATATGVAQVFAKCLGSINSNVWH